MGQLYDLKLVVDRIIAEKGLDENMARGQISMKAGFMLSLLKPTSPDDPEKSARLRDAVLEVTGTRI